MDALLADLLGRGERRPAPAECAELEGLLEVVLACGAAEHALADLAARVDGVGVSHLADQARDPALRGRLFVLPVEILVRADRLDAGRLLGLVEGAPDARSRARIAALLLARDGGHGARRAAGEALRRALGEGDLVGAEIVLDALCEHVWGDDAGLEVTTDFLRDAGCRDVARERLTELLVARFPDREFEARRAVFDIVHDGLRAKEPPRPIGRDQCRWGDSPCHHAGV